MKPSHVLLKTFYVFAIFEVRGPRWTTSPPGRLSVQPEKGQFGGYAVLPRQNSEGLKELMVLIRRQAGWPGSQSGFYLSLNSFRLTVSPRVVNSRFNTLSVFIHVRKRPVGMQATVGGHCSLAAK